MVLVMGTLVTGADIMQSSKELPVSMERNDYGKGKKTQELDVTVGKNKKKIRTKVEVSERKYSTDEIQEVFARIIRRMDGMILGENKTPDHVEKNLNLVTEIPGEPVNVSWELDRYDVMNIRGEILGKNISENGTLVKLNAVLTYTEDEKEQASYQCVVCVYPPKLTGEEKIKRDIEEKLTEADAKETEKKRMLLPDMLGNKELRYYRPFDNRGPVLLVMGVIIGALLYALQKQNEKKAQEDRKKQMLRDYSEIINKLTLYLGAGMTVKRAWKKVTEGYMQEKAAGTERYAYEEMRRTYSIFTGSLCQAEYCRENYGKKQRNSLSKEKSMM